MRNLKVEDPLLQSGQVARILGLSTATVERMRAEGWGPPYVRIRRSIRYWQSDVLAWVDANRVASK